jgi:hypothetical protein
MADHEDIFIKILTVVGVTEWVCLGLWLFYSSLSLLHTWLIQAGPGVCRVSRAFPPALAPPVLLAHVVSDAGP